MYNNLYEHKLDLNILLVMVHNNEMNITIKIKCLFKEKVL